jgi:hypothetical protein
LSPHVVAIDSGSTDSGPQKLGLGSMTRSREAYVKDISLILRQAVPKRMSCWRRPVCHALPLVHTHSTAENARAMTRASSRKSGYVLGWDCGN